MMVKKHKGYVAKVTSRMFMIVLLFCVVVGTLCYTLVQNLSQVSEMKKELNGLEKEKRTLQELEEITQADIVRLSDSAYVARYAREKYFYSKDGEIILRMVD